MLVIAAYATRSPITVLTFTFGLTDERNIEFIR
jgi:hypothetical protein